MCTSNSVDVILTSVWKFVGTMSENFKKTLNYHTHWNEIELLTQGILLVFDVVGQWHRNSLQLPDYKITS